MFEKMNEERNAQAYQPIHIRSLQRKYIIFTEIQKVGNGQERTTNR